MNIDLAPNELVLQHVDFSILKDRYRFSRACNILNDEDVLALLATQYFNLHLSINGDDNLTEEYRKGANQGIALMLTRFSDIDGRLSALINSIPTVEEN